MYIFIFNFFFHLNKCTISLCKFWIFLCLNMIDLTNDLFIDCMLFPIDCIASISYFKYLFDNFQVYGRLGRQPHLQEKHYHLVVEVVDRWTETTTHLRLKALFHPLRHHLLHQSGLRRRRKPHRFLIKKNSDLWLSSHRNPLGSKSNQNKTVPMYVYC